MRSVIFQNMLQICKERKSNLVHVNVNPDFVQVLKVLQIAILCLKGRTLSHAVTVIGFVILRAKKPDMHRYEVVKRSNTFSASFPRIDVSFFTFSQNVLRDLVFLLKL